MSDFKTRKAERTKRFQELRARQWIECPACAGSGVYDNSPPTVCGCCNGTGKRPLPLEESGT